MRLAPCLMLLAVLTVAGSAAAQTVPAASPALAAVPAASTLPAAASLPIATPELDLAKILGVPATGGASSPQEPVWMSCTVPQCRRGCGCSFGCVANCIDITTCECECICGLPQK
jgi:hypothetical protein